MVAVQKNANAIRHIQNPSEAVQILIVNKSFEMAKDIPSVSYTLLQQIKNPSEKISLMINDLQTKLIMNKL